LRAYRECASSTHWDEWSAALPPLPRATVTELLRWLDVLCVNSPTALWTEHQTDNDAIIFVDASEEKWSATAVTATTVQTTSRKWPKVEPSSVTAEPSAVWLALCRFVNPAWTNVIIVTDHLPMVFAADKGYAKGYTYNQLLSKCHSAFPRLTCRFRFIPGKDHPSDEPSRGLPLNQEKLAAALKTIHRQIEVEVHEKETKKNGGNGEWCQTASNPYKLRTMG